MHGYILLGVFESSTKWSSVILSTDFHLRQNSSSYNFNVCVTTVHVAHRALILYMRIQCSAALSTVLVEMQVATKWVGMYQLRKHTFAPLHMHPKRQKMFSIIKTLLLTLLDAGYPWIVCKLKNILFINIDNKFQTGKNVDIQLILTWYYYHWWENLF